MLCTSYPLANGRFPKVIIPCRIKIHYFKILIKDYYKRLSMTFAFFFQKAVEQFSVLSLLMLDLFCIFILNLSVMFLLIMVILNLVKRIL